MVDDIIIHIFRGLGLEDPEEFWFVADAVWKARKITDKYLKKAQLITMLQERALTWYMKYFVTNQAASLDDIKKALISEFKKPKLESI